MECSVEALQAFLDGELEPAGTEAVRRHLGRCPACRRELSRLRLLWLELEQEEEIEIPYELPYIRQQAVAKAGAAMREIGVTPGVSYWDAQKLAWQPVLAGVSLIPGTRQLGRLARTAGRGLPAAVRTVSSLLGAIAARRRGRP
ncbi:MAG: zf-HC2 domain-containing protein [Peptococcaceae bacterium]|nr:zf-HC2 domain-containing protein [Peptococcaceae bacterium]